jgi:type III secretion protein U
VLDLFLKRREYLTELSMSHDEMRRESKDEEGDPLVKSMRRSLHEQLLMQDLVKRVRKARVVVVEPAA